MSIRNVIKKIARRMIFGATENSESFINYLKRTGVKIGEGTVFYDPTTTVVDIQNPKLLCIGNNVRITKGVTILTHDYSWSVLAGKYGECLGGVAPVTIGDNVFIGINAIITKGVTIGNNVIIGAGSVVTKNCDSDSVYAGVPSRKICTLDTYYQKKKEQQLDDAITILNSVSDCEDYSTMLREYGALFLDVESAAFQKLIVDTGYQEKCEMYYRNHNRMFNNLEELIAYYTKLKV